MFLFFPIGFLIDALFGSVLGALFVPSLISFSLNSVTSLFRLLFPMEMPEVPAAM